jgi:hypothetical protein
MSVSAASRFFFRVAQSVSCLLCADEQVYPVTVEDVLAVLEHLRSSRQQEQAAAASTTDAEPLPAMPSIDPIVATTAGVFATDSGSGGDGKRSLDRATSVLSAGSSAAVPAATVAGPARVSEQLATVIAGESAATATAEAKDSSADAKAPAAALAGSSSLFHTLGDFRRTLRVSLVDRVLEGMSLNVEPTDSTVKYSAAVHG